MRHDVDRKADRKWMANIPLLQCSTTALIDAKYTCKTGLSFRLRGTLSLLCRVNCVILASLPHILTKTGIMCSGLCVSQHFPKTSCLYIKSIAAHLGWSVGFFSINRCKSLQMASTDLNYKHKLVIKMMFSQVCSSLE